MKITLQERDIIATIFEIKMVKMLVCGDCQSQFEITDDIFNQTSQRITCPHCGEGGWMKGEKLLALVSA